MRRYKVSLAERMRRQQRYATDPQFRLRTVNHSRVRYGLEPYASVDEIPTYSEMSSRAARNRPRKADGTFA